MADPVVGTLLPPHTGYPAYTQPGGPGTPTFPQQQSGGTGNQAVNGVPQELGMGLFTAGCGHWFNSWDVRCQAVGGVSSALLCCPLCCYLERIITPYSLIYADANYVLLG